MNPANLSAVLLAGGESIRMGRDKAKLEVDGKPLWQHQLALLESLKPTEIFVSARTDPDWRPGNTIFVPDEPPSVGPLSGIAATLRKSHGSHLLVLAVDLHSITPEYLESLIDQAAPVRGVVPMIGNRAEPLAAIFPAEAAVDFESALGQRDHSLQKVVRKLLHQQKVRVVPVNDDEQKYFRNINSPADLAE